MRLNSLFNSSAINMRTVVPVFNNDGEPVNPNPVIAANPNVLHEGVVVIKTDNGPVRINASDYDKDKHTLHEADDTFDEHGVRKGPLPAPAPQPVAGQTLHAIPDNANHEPEAPFTMDDAALNNRVSAINFGSMQSGKKFIVVDATDNGKPVDFMPNYIAPGGYKSNKEAWEAIFKVRERAATANLTVEESGYKAPDDKAVADTADTGNASEQPAA